MKKQSVTTDCLREQLFVGFEDSDRTEFLLAQTTDLSFDLCQISYHQIDGIGWTDRFLSGSAHFLSCQILNSFWVQIPVIDRESIADNLRQVSQYVVRG